MASTQSNGVSYSKWYQDATSIPAKAGATQYSVANPIPAGLVEQWGIRIVGGSAGAMTATGLTELVSSLRLTINGDQIINFNTSACDITNAGQSRLGALVDDIGGIVAEKPSDTDNDCTIWFPMGLNLPQNSRFELSLAYVASADDLTNPKFEVWAKYGSASSCTVIGNATSQTMATNAQVMMTVKIPTFKGAKVSGIALQNVDNTDTLTEVIVKPLGDWAMSPAFLRGASGAGQNGYQFVSPTVDANANIYASQVDGYYFIPLYDLAMTDGSVTLLVTANDNVVMTATPILTLPTGGSGQSTPKQTASEKTGASQSILRRAEE